METIRSFISIDFPEQAIKMIRETQKSLNNAIPPIVRWVKSENIHLTLKFLGNVQLQKIRVIEAALDQIANEIEPFPLILEGIGSFPNWEHPRIIWIGIVKSELVRSLAELIEAKMVALDCEKETKSFSPHLTIGRVREHISPEDIQMLEKRTWINTIFVDKIKITGIHLYKSDLHASGPIYTLLHFSPFKRVL